MAERQIAVEDVERALSASDVIENYTSDQPYPSQLVLGWSGSRPIHVVMAENSADNQIIVITVYEPDPGQWDESFRRRSS